MHRLFSCSSPCSCYRVVHNSHRVRNCTHPCSGYRVVRIHAAFIELLFTNWRTYFIVVAFTFNAPKTEVDLRSLALEISFGLFSICMPFYMGLPVGKVNESRRCYSEQYVPLLFLFCVCIVQCSSTYHSSSLFVLCSVQSHVPLLVPLLCIVWCSSTCHFSPFVVLCSVHQHVPLLVHLLCYVQWSSMSLPRPCYVQRISTCLSS